MAETTNCVNMGWRLTLDASKGDSAIVLCLLITVDGPERWAVKVAWEVCEEPPLLSPPLILAARLL